MNNSIMLESFLKYCDEMIIANEGFGNIIESFKRRMIRFFNNVLNTLERMTHKIKNKKIRDFILNIITKAKRGLNKSNKLDPESTKEECDEIQEIADEVKTDMDSATKMLVDEKSAQNSKIVRLYEALDDNIKENLERVIYEDSLYRFSELPEREQDWAIQGLYEYIRRMYIKNYDSKIALRMSVKSTSDIQELLSNDTRKTIDNLLVILEEWISHTTKWKLWYPSVGSKNYLEVFALNSAYTDSKVVRVEIPGLVRTPKIYSDSERAQHKPLVIVETNYR